MYDLKEIKSVPILEVCAKYGIDLEKKHGRFWGKLRNEKTASFSVNTERNSWYDFGMSKGGSNIDLVMELMQVEKNEAIKRLAEDFGFKNEKTRGWSPLLDSQYYELGVIPERANLNFKYDLRVHTPEQLGKWNQKYGMHIRELAENNPEAYNQLVSKIAIEKINIIRDTYFTKIKLATDPSLSADQRNLYKGWAEIDSQDIKARVDLLQRAYKGKASFENLRVDIVKDYKELMAQNKGMDRPLSEDEIIRNKVVEVYKNMYHFNQADYLTVNHAKALVTLNQAMNTKEEKYLPIEEIKDLYKNLGVHMQTVAKSYDEMMKAGASIPENTPEYAAWEDQASNAKNEMEQLKDLFSKCSNAVNGLREASMAYKNDITKQQVPEKVQAPAIEPSQ